MAALTRRKNPARINQDSLAKNAITNGDDHPDYLKVQTFAVRGVGLLSTCK